MGSIFGNFLNTTTKDVFYTPLPLHHTAGGILGVGQGIAFGIPVVLRNKFSVSNFWKDCIKYKCTVKFCNSIYLTTRKPSVDLYR